MVRKNAYCSGSYKRVSETLLSDIRSVPVNVNVGIFRRVYQLAITND